MAKDLFPKYRNRFYIGPGVINPKGHNSLPRPIDDRLDGIEQQIANQNAVASILSHPPQPDDVYGHVALEPEKVLRNDIINFFTSDQYSNLPEDQTTEFWKVHVRIPERNLEMTRALAHVGAEPESLALMPNPISDVTAQLIFPHFYLPVNDDSSPTSPSKPEVGDLVRVKFIDDLKTQGWLIEIVERSGASMGGSATMTPEAAAAAFADLKNPISTVFEADVGPTATRSANPGDISRLAPGPTLVSPNGSLVETYIIGGTDGSYQLVKADIAPHLVALLRDYTAVNNAPDLTINSGFRVAFIRDNTLSLEEVNIKCQNTAYLNYDGNPYPFFTKSPATQESLRKKHCPDPVNSPAGNCKPPTAPPGSSGHQSGISYDFSVYMGWQDAKRNAAPHRISAQYRWMSLNAYKYGFIRTVKSERWHWDFYPGSHQFQRVPRNHYTWDMQFNESISYGDMDTV
jgi:hypothetical protein